MSFLLWVLLCRQEYIIEREGECRTCSASLRKVEWLTHWCELGVKPPADRTQIYECVIILILSTREEIIYHACKYGEQRRRRLSSLMTTVTGTRTLLPASTTRSRTERRWTALLAESRRQSKLRACSDTSGALVGAWWLAFRSSKLAMKKSRRLPDGRENNASWWSCSAEKQQMYVHKYVLRNRKR